MKGKVVHLSATKSGLVVSSGTLMKRECYIVDPSRHIKVILWEKPINSSMHFDTCSQHPAPGESN